jgi:phage gp16-like protein
MALKSATPDSTESRITREIRAGWEKKAAKPPQPKMARPRWARVAMMVMNAILGVVIVGTRRGRSRFI